jgi:hypothetical protein
MIIVLDENNTLQLTEKAFMIGDFRELYDSYKDQELAMAAFSIMYYMYHFGSHFLYDYFDEKERFKEVQKFVYRGTEITYSKIKIAMDTYRDLYDKESVSTYLIMKRNVDKLKIYASKMELIIPVTETEDEEGNVRTEKKLDPEMVYVDYKEFVAINSMLPKQQQDLELFENRLIESVKNQIDIYGGGDLGAYER